MKSFALATLLALSTTPVLAAVPFCRSPPRNGGAVVAFQIEIEIGELSEADRARFYDPWTLEEIPLD